MARKRKKNRRAIEEPIATPAAPPEKAPGALARLRRWLSNSFFTGMLVTIPILATYVIVKFLISLIDRRVPEWMRPDIQFLGYRFPLVGIMLAILFVLLIGMLTRNLVGRRVLKFGEGLIQRIPVARAIYVSAKQLTQTLFSQQRENFKRVVLIEYPRTGLYTMAFVTSRPVPPYVPPDSEPLLAVFVPTTPNPTSGFFLMVREKDAITLAITVEQAFRAVISAGMTTGATVETSAADFLTD